MEQLARISCALFMSVALGDDRAHAQTREFETSERAALHDVYPERITRFPNAVTGLSDVVYSTISGYRPLIVDLYLPPGQTTPRPLVLYVHGGGWMGGHTRHGGAVSDFPRLLAALASEGFVVASVEYRLASEAPYPAQIQDARAAVRFLKSNAARFGLDPDRVAVWGASAGGQIAALLGAGCGVASLDAAPAPDNSECIQGAAIWYGVFDFAPIVASMSNSVSGASNPVAALLRCDGTACASEAVTRASPINFVDASDPPFLLLHGDGDETVPATQSRAMEARLRDVGVSVDAHYIPNVDHSFVGANPTETHAASMRAINLTFDFFHRVLDPPRP